FRSKHNTYIVIPVVMIMISNHYPIATYGHQYNWLILGGLTLVGWAIAHVIRKQ
ncbi:MAG TPA: urate hydroxylase PuuD, partial [Thermoanaerobaculia bacterium]